MIKKILLFLSLLILANNFVIANEIPESKINEFNDNFITIYLHGYWSKLAYESTTEPEVFNDIFRVRGLEEVEGKKKDYYFNKTTKSLMEQGYRNIFAYSFTNGWDKNANKINGQSPKYMSDVLVREIGDFNYGSQVMKNEREYNMYKQCLIGVAKTEWVFSKYIKENNLSDFLWPDWNERDKLSTEYYEEIILSFGSFFSLLSAEYIKKRLEKFNLGGKSYYEILCPDGSKTIDEVADELWRLAWQCPNRINFVVHSMGGMHLFRYLNGKTDGEEMYGYNTERSSTGESLYKYYQNYTKAKYENEKQYYNDPNFFRSFERLDTLGGEDLANFSDTEFSLFVNSILKAHDESYWNTKIQAYDPLKDINNITKDDKDLILYLMFVKERENSVYKVATEDSPLLGSDCATLWPDILTLFGDKDLATNFMLTAYACFLANVVIESFVFISLIYTIVKAVIDGKDITYILELISMIPLVLLLDGLFLIALVPLLYLISYYFGGLMADSNVFYSLHDFFSDRSDQLEELKPDSYLINTYKNKTAPPDQKPYSNDPVRIYTTSYSGTPTPKSGMDKTTMYVNIVMGYTQRVLLRELLVSFVKLQKQAISLLNLTFDHLNNPEMDIPDVFDSVTIDHPMVKLLIAILGVLEIDVDTNGSLLVPTKSARGQGVGWIGGSKNYHLDKTTADLSELISNFADAFNGAGMKYDDNFPYNEENYPYGTFVKSDGSTYNPWLDGVAEECFGLHGWSQNILAYKIFFIKNNKVFFEGSPYKNVMKITDCSGNTTGGFNNLPFANDLTRNLYNHIFLDNPHGLATVNNISVPQQNKFGNVYEADVLAQPINKGLSCNFIQNNSYENKPLNYLTTSTYVRALPVTLYNYYDGMKTYFSINGTAFKEAEMIDGIDDYAVNHSNDPLPSMVYSNNGEACIASPRLKEGYNTVTYKFEDMFGREIIKDMVIEQNLISPFIKPIHPVMNEYINTSLCTVKIQAYDITKTKPVDKWFLAENCTLSIDDIEIPLSQDDFDTGDYTISVDADGLSDGNHTLYFKVDYKGSINERAYRFWVDTTGPEIEFPPTIIFSNKDNNNKVGLGALIKDSVPYTNSYGDEIITYQADTVFLNNVNIKVDNNIDLYDEVDTRLGMHSFAWNGWDNGLPLSHGYHTLSASAIDRMGNHNEGSTQFIIDNQAPVFNEVLINADLINTNTGLLQIDYNFSLDEWEDGAKLEVVFHNTTENEVFTLEHQGEGDKDNVMPIMYVSEGDNLLKDGIYDIAITAVDECGNKSESVEFNSIVVDMHRPDIDYSYTYPFIVKDNSYDISVNLRAKEKDPVDINKSSSLDLILTLLDQYDQTVDSFVNFESKINPDEVATFDFVIPTDLPSGEYYFKAYVTDKNENTQTEYIAFIKDAISPSITYPQDLQITDGNITIRGRVGDPRWDNNLTFDHYELYYRYGDKLDNIDLNDLDSNWLIEDVKVPEYQLYSDNNYGKFTVEQDGILGFIDTYNLNNSLVTILLIAVEADNYKIATQRTFRVLHHGDQYFVNAVMDENYVNKTTSLDFSQNDLNISYEIQNDLNNPVDIFVSIKDQEDQVIRSSSLLNIQNTDINDEPVLTSTDKGVFIWDDNSKINVLLKNSDATSDINFTVVITSEDKFYNLHVNSDETDDLYFVNLVENDTRIVCSTNLISNESYGFDFDIDTLTGMNINVIAANEITTIYLGKNKTPISGGNATIYKGAEYPPINWDGKDEWGRYVQNGTYMITLEALGNLGGYDVEKCYIDTSTPTLVNVTNAMPLDKKIQPGMPNASNYSINGTINKTADLLVEVIDVSGDVIKTIHPSPSYIEQRGDF